ncbi:MAG: acyl-CoA dehydrogenase [Pseudomonadales bacterium]|nr:acyl-CoA dehydrogenase [Pseudomonadales bacterium]
MTAYIAPIKEMSFVLNSVANLGIVCDQPRFDTTSPEIVTTVLDQAAKFATNILAPLNTVGDLIGSTIVDSQVREASGFAEAYQRFIDDGWTTLPCDPEFGGMGLPLCVGIATMEMWSAANLSFALCPMLGQGAIEALQSHASDYLRQQYLANMIAGQWTGTMNLTEAQAGSDLAAINTSARPKTNTLPQPNLTNDDQQQYLIQGNKIFITWGDHQMTDNIIHLVLARIDGAPAGVKGISLFLVPKYLPEENGLAGQQNDVVALSVEHKMGIHGSPTCVMSYGSNSEGAVGYLIGEENMGLSYMFTMMNNARLNVGTQGVALSDRAYQQAVSYAQQRVQGIAPGAETNGAIIDHPDVKRMLMLMRALTEASRALCYVTAANFDMGNHCLDPQTANAALRRGELLTPLAKAWSTEVSQEVTTLGMQVHGGMGYIEETGAAQLMRDARITTIYEGTTGIQANDFIGRKIIRDQGAEMHLLLNELQLTLTELEDISSLKLIKDNLHESSQALEQGLQWLFANHQSSQGLAATVASNFLMGVGTCIAGWLMAKSALVAHQKLIDNSRITNSLGEIKNSLGEITNSLGDNSNEPNLDSGFYTSKITTCRFYAAHILPRCKAYFAAVQTGMEPDLVLSAERF